MSPELIGILSVGVALAALNMASIKGLRDDMKSMGNRLDSLEQRMAHLEGLLEGLREALFERARETAK